MKYFIFLLGMLCGIIFAYAMPVFIVWHASGN